MRKGTDAIPRAVSYLSQNSPKPDPNPNLEHALHSHPDLNIIALKPSLLTTRHRLVSPPEVSIAPKKPIREAIRCAASVLSPGYVICDSGLGVGVGLGLGLR